MDWWQRHARRINEVCVPIIVSPSEHSLADGDCKKGFGAGEPKALEGFRIVVGGVWS